MTASNNRNSSDATDPAADQPPPSELATIGLTLLGTFIAARCLAVISRLATALAAPAMGFYLFSTCPTSDSFDGKKELKRVLRGEKLPEDHPDKPKEAFTSLLKDKFLTRSPLIHYTLPCQRWSSSWHNISSREFHSKQGFFEKAMAKVSASIEAEAAALAGCKVEIMDIMGIVKVASIQHPLTKTAYFWLGAVNKWRYVMAKDFPEGEGGHTKTE
ncbi:hypothetical protein ACHAWF_015473 [Thalassiosira exigua]